MAKLKKEAKKPRKKVKKVEEPKVEELKVEVAPVPVVVAPKPEPVKEPTEVVTEVEINGRKYKKIYTIKDGTTRTEPL